MCRAGEAAGRLLPISKPVLFELSGPADRATAACGLGVYRDDLLGAEFTGNTFTCEPVQSGASLAPASRRRDVQRPSARR